MLHRSPIGGRDFAVIGLAVLLPLVLAAMIGYRALGNEAAARQRETEIELDDSARRIRVQALGEIDEASQRLGRAEVPADPEGAIRAVEALMPKLAVAVVLAGDGALRMPAPALRESSDPACEKSAKRIALRIGDAERRDLAKKIVEQCPDVRSESGRYLFSILVLDGLHPVDPKRFTDWLEGHAPSFTNAERAATERAISRADWLDPGARQRARDAMKRQVSGRDELAQKLSGVAARRAIAQLDGEHALSRFTGEGAMGALRRLDEKTIVGFIVTPQSLGSGLSMFDVPAELVVTPSAGSGPHAVAELADGLSLVVGLSDPHHVEHLTAQSRRWLAASGLVLAVLALALGGLALSRVRGARRLSELRTDFVSAVSHELRTPIASVSMLAELLEQGRVEETERGEVYAALAKEARRLGETVDWLLSFSRMSAGRVTAQRRSLPVAEPVLESLAEFEERHPEARIEQSIEAGISAVVDPDQVRLAVDNLLANALKYAPDGQPYRVSVEAHDADVWISVTDRGPGVAARDRTRIFEPFERADDRLHQATEGSGIGLSLVRHVAESHGGRAWVESESGRGARFVLALPRGVA